MKIKTEIEIFDDPEYCETSHTHGDPNHKMCPRLVWGSGCCSQFREDVKYFKKLANGKKGFLKLDQCKSMFCYTGVL